MWGYTLPPPPTIAIDADLRPNQPSIRGLAGESRRLARITDSHSNEADFVESEVLLFTEDGVAVKSFASRLHGRVISHFDFSQQKGTALPSVYLVGIDASAVDISTLSSDLRISDKLSRGKHLVSSDAGLRTLAAAARENASGVRAGLNWVFSSNSFATWSTTEGPSGFTHDQRNWRNDAFHWPYTCHTGHPLTDTDCVQDIGVAAAWRALAAADKLSNQVNITIWDSGFDPNPDFPSQTVIEPPNTIGLPGPGMCGNQSCPFHGTEVVAAGMAVPDNQFGAAGPGGPVANLTLISSPSPDFFSILESVPTYLSSLGHAQILNISATADIPASVCLFSCSAIDGVFEIVRNEGILVFASAGNDGTDVDEHDCAGPFCWESGASLPCEAKSVICVGGLEWNSKIRAGKSNWGSDSSNPGDGETVRIFGPYDVWVYDAHHISDAGVPDPPGVFLESGTSFASPFVAGVAALVWAANPSLSADEVEDILFRTAHSSPDQTVPRYIDAFESVRSALGGHVPPNILIDSPADGSVYHKGDEIFIHAIAVDEDTLSNISNSIQWSSDVTSDGPFPSGPSLLPTHDLAVGVHTITASISAHGYVERASVTIHILEQPIYITMINPYPGENYSITDPIYLDAEATQGGRSLPANQVHWSIVDSAGIVRSLGSVFHPVLPAGSLAIGSYQVQFGVFGVADQALATITVHPAPGPPPHVTIDSPLNGTLGGVKK